MILPENGFKKYREAKRFAQGKANAAPVFFIQNTGNKQYYCLWNIPADWKGDNGVLKAPLKLLDVVYS